MVPLYSPAVKVVAPVMVIVVPETEAITPWNAIGFVNVGEISVTVGVATVPAFTVTLINPTGAVEAVEESAMAAAAHRDNNDRERRNFFMV